MSNSSHTPPGNWSVYLLYNSGTGRTYIGATTDPARRLRQHRGELKGGAKATGKCWEDWRMVCFLSGFQDKSTAYRWEKILKMRRTGLPGRLGGFGDIISRACPISARFKKYHAVPDGLTLSFPEDVPIRKVTKKKKEKK